MPDELGAPPPAVAPEQAQAHQTQEQVSPPKGPIRSVLELLMIAAMALGLVLLVNFLFVKPYRIPSESMEPTLDVGQRILANRMSYDFGRTPHRGDIVVFHPPTGADTDICGAAHEEDQVCPLPVSQQNTGVNFIKRVVGVPGDTLSVRDSRVVINGQLQDEPYIIPCEPGTCDYPRPIQVPPGYFFMMGDNRGHSDDSRFWGPVPSSWLIGRAFLTYWPPDRIGSL